MTPEQKENLRSHVYGLSEIYGIASNCYLHSFCFLQLIPGDRSRRDWMILHSPSLRFFNLLCRRSLVLEMAKLFQNSRNQNFNIEKLINNFKIGKMYGDLSAHTKIFNDWLERIESKKDGVKEICKLRDEIIAHSDKNISFDYTKINNHPDYYDSLLEIIEDVICYISENIIEHEISAKLGETDLPGILDLLEKNKWYALAHLSNLSARE